MTPELVYSIEVPYYKLESIIIDGALLEDEIKIIKLKVIILLLRQEQNIGTKSLLISSAFSR